MQKYQNVDTYRHLYLKMYRIMTGKYKCHMACNSYKIHDVERMSLGHIEVYVLQKMILVHINEIPPHGQRDFIWHAISLHPLSMRNICEICENINMKTDTAIPSCGCV